MFKQGDTVKILPAYQDSGDELYTWVCCEDEDGGRVRVVAQGTGLTYAPQYVVYTSWIAKA